MNNMSETNLMIEPQDWTFPVPIAYGPGRLNGLTKKESLNIKKQIAKLEKNLSGIKNLDKIGMTRSFF